ncbi:MAG TPA: T9SS type A sorting domain-containing protein, partial [Chitinophagaceae bacterium]|nr:T9SS type A sorting domain-containing protein [Chitinophagaceae bacterium]
ILPSTNTAVPGLKLSGNVESVIIDSGGIFINGSGAGSGSPLQLAGKMRLNNGGKYVHRTPRGNAELIDKLVMEPGTEKGMFEFDVPGTSGYTVSLTGNSFGSLIFRASAAGGAKSYSGSGTSNLTIHGDLIIEQGALLTSTLTSDINLGGNLFINGVLNLHPVTAGTTGRSFVFGGKDAVFQGTGTFSMNAFFRNLLVAKNASLTLETPCLLSFTPNTFICQGRLHCKGGYVGGPGSFLLSEDASIFVGSGEGIWQSADRGDIKTAFRNFSNRANYYYIGTTSQVSGDGIPDTVATLGIDNINHLSLSKPVVVSGILELLSGKIVTDAVNLLVMVNTTINSPVNAWGNSNQGWESSFVAGPLKVVTNDTAWKMLPMGIGSEFAPIKLKAPFPDPQSVILEYKAGTNINTTLLPSLTRLGSRGHYLASWDGPAHWQIGLSCTPADSGLSSTELMSVALLQQVNGEWKWGNTQASLSTNQAGFGWLHTDTAVTGFAALAIGYIVNSLLPLELLEFSARNAGKYNQISWRANQDGKDAIYVLERSPDGRLFKPLTEIVSPRRNQFYHHWNDDAPLSPFGYYRLLLKNGTGSLYSQVVRVRYNKPRAVLYPNPASEWIAINFSNKSSDTELEVVNSNGAILRKHIVKNNLFHIRVSDLNPGFFFVRIRSSGEIITLPFTKY